MTDPLRPGQTIGILGGGQLARMLAVAASRLGLRTHVFDPAQDPPAAQVCNVTTTATFDDRDALARFADAVDVVTYEFENIPTDALDVIEAHRPIYPSRHALQISQDRLTEKTFLSELGLKTAPFAPVNTTDELQNAVQSLGLPAILKTRRFGYDGKGQVVLHDERDIDGALDQLAHAPAILEGFVPFQAEISVIAARALDGSIACFDPGENVHRDGILRTTTVPANIPARLKQDAVLAASRILGALDYVGVLGVELFVAEAKLIVNEIAPRVHNSGHWTQNGCAVDQFEQHIRAIAGWSLGDGVRFADVTMENILGDDITRGADWAAERDVAVHLYGKADARPGRKMGHINRIRRLSS